jgi:arabinose-5-phosphate isomerase
LAICKCKDAGYLMSEPAKRIAISRATANSPALRPIVPDESTSTDGASLTPFERLRLARDVMRDEASAILDLIDTAGPSIVDVGERISRCEGSVIVTGIGKAGLVGQKIVATLASTGSPAHFLHPSEAIHGDLGRIGRRDLVWVFSYSGRSEEVVRLLPTLRRLSAGTLATTENRENPVGSWADSVIPIGRIDEACTLGLAPSTSTTLMLATGDAAALLASRLRGFTERDFARFHPGGSLGRKLSKVDRWMRDRRHCRIASQRLPVRDVMCQASAVGQRRTGAVMLVDDDGRLSGIFTDSDLVRLLESRRYETLDQPVETVMTRNVQTVSRGTLLGAAIEVLAGKKISELPVIDSDRRPVGLLDITDVIAVGESVPGVANPTAKARRSNHAG